MDSNNEDNQMNEDKKIEKPKALDRVTIGTGEAEKVSNWINQINQSSGFLQVSRSDLLNFLIREHREDLTTKELSQLRAAHYDPVRHLNWITPRLKEALAKGDLAAVSKLQSEIRGIELAVIDQSGRAEAPKPARRQRSKKLTPTESAPTVEPKAVSEK